MEGSLGGGKEGGGGGFEEKDMSHLLAQPRGVVTTTSSLKSGWEGFFSNYRNGQWPADQWKRAAAADSS